jgi:serine/arginine repetitive matrix protein 1
MTGFLEKKTPMFMSSLWDLLISAQDSIGGIPAAFLDKAKQKILEQKVLISV